MEGLKTIYNGVDILELTPRCVECSKEVIIR